MFYVQTKNQDIKKMKKFIKTISKEMGLILLISL